MKKKIIFSLWKKGNFGGALSSPVVGWKKLENRYYMVIRNFKVRCPGTQMKKWVCFVGSCFLLGTAFAQEDVSGETESYAITPGRGYGVLTFSLDQRNAQNENQLFRTVIDQDKVNYRVTASGGYALKNNFTVGLGLSYGRQREDITFLNEDEEEITSKSLGQDVSFIPNIRKYVPLGAGKLQIFIQTDLRISLGESLQRDFLPAEIEKVEENFTELKLGVQPGVVLFFTRNWAFEASVGIAGVTTRWSTKTFNDDQANQAKIQESNIDLKLNLLALNLGVAYYFDF